MWARPDAAGASVAREPERVLVALLALGAIVALVLFRAADDNRLTSWRWVFADARPARLYALVAAAIVLAHLASRRPLLDRRPAAVLFVAAYAAGACCWGAPETIVDAARYFTQAKHLEVYGVRSFVSEWGRAVPAWTDLPLVPLLYGLVFKLLGETRLHVEAFTTLLFASSVVLTRRLGATLWDEEVGFAAGALLLAMPFLLAQVPEMLVDVPTMFFLTLAVCAVTEAFQRGGTGRIALAAVAVVLALLCKYSTWLLLTVLPVIGVVQARRGAPRPGRTAALMAVVALPLVAAAALVLHDAIARQLALLVSYQAPGLRRWGESVASMFLFQIHPFVTAAAVLSVALAIRRRDPTYLVVAWPVVLLCALQVRRIRYVVPALPMLALMAAYGLQAIRSSELRRFVVACAVASSLVVALYGYLPFLEGTSAANLKHAGEYLDSIDEQAVEVVTVAGLEPEVNPAVSVPLLDLFTTKHVVFTDDPVPPPPAARLNVSPLRFTWEYVNPAYYAPSAAAPRRAIAVISDDPARPLPDAVVRRLQDHRLARVFAADEGVFEYRTIVSVFRPVAP